MRDTTNLCASLLALLLSFVSPMAAAVAEKPTVFKANNPLAECKTFPVRPAPSNVRDLRPQDIRVVTAIGDSVSAGFAMKGGFWEYRDFSFPMGGHDGAYTLANFLRRFNSAITGFSTKDHWLELSGDPHKPEDDHCNAAQSDARIWEAKNHQLPYLLKQLKQLNDTTDFQLGRDWVFMSMFLGANDFCEVCTNSSKTPAILAGEMEELLTLIKSSIPRVFISFMSFGNMSSVAKIDRKRWGCTELHKHVDECECLFKNATDSQLTHIDEVIQGYNDELMFLAKKFNGMNDPGFGIGIQTFTRYSLFTARDLLSSLDCFHPSALCHEYMAIGLWNSMIRPVGEKMKVWVDGTTPICPSETDQLYLTY